MSQQFLKNKRFIILTFRLLLFGLCVTEVYPAEAGVAIIMSRNIQPYQIAWQGFNKTLKPNVSRQVYDLPKGENKYIVEEINSFKPMVILAIGKGALLFAEQNFSGIPIVFTMVLNPSRIFDEKPPNITGVKMNSSSKQVFENLREIAPGVRKIGIIMDPTYSEEKPAQLIQTAADYGYELLLKITTDISTAISEFKNMEYQIDAFWLMPNPTVINPTLYKYILLSSYRNKFALIGLSKKHTRQGSLFSVTGDNTDWGIQAAIITNKILAGAAPEHIPLRFAKKYTVFINMQTAGRIGIAIPEKIKRKADGVFE